MNQESKNINVSIVIPCRNEEKYIGKCIESIVNCDYPKSNLHVFIVDGLSDDNTIDIVNTYCNQCSWIHLISNNKKTTPFALNMGINASANCDITIILGAHAEIFPDYVTNCVNILQSHPEVACVGGILNSISENETTKAISFAMSSLFGVGNAHFRTGTKEGYVDTVAFGAYRTAIFSEIGQFDEKLIRNQDDEFNYRLLKNGHKIYLSKSIVSNYYVRSSFTKLFKQYYQYGFWKVYVNLKHKSITTLRQTIPFLFVAFLVIGSVLSFINLIFAITFLAIILFYFILGLSFSIKSSTNINFNLKTLASYLLLHLGYGLGYWYGIIYFILLSKKNNKSDVSLTR